MRAMVLNQCAPIEASPLQWQEVAVPQPGLGEVRVQVKACGICRTDLHVIEGELPRLGHPIIPGHQVVGVVDALGAHSSRFEIGQRLGIAWLRHTCGVCEECRTGRENLCASPLFTGYHAAGGYAEYCVVPEAFAYPIPDVFEDAEATPLLCAGIIGYRSLKRSRCEPGHSLALFGFGSSALLCSRLLATGVVRSMSARVARYTRSWRWSWGPGGPVLPPKKCRGRWTVPSSLPLQGTGPAALRSLRKGGTLALAGIYMTPIPEMDYERHLFYEKNICSVTANTRQDGVELLQTAAKIPIRPNVRLFSLLAANEALLRLKQDKIQGSGVLLPNI